MSWHKPDSKMMLKLFGNTIEEDYAVQARLKYLGFDPGKIDGIWGRNTQTAYDLWLDSLAEFEQEYKPETVPVGLDEIPFPADRSTVRLFTTAEARRIFGEPNAIGRILVMVKPWHNLTYDGKHIAGISCHPMIAAALGRVFSELADVYTRARWQELGLREYNGCYNVRPMTGGSNPSKHSFAIAFDFSASTNAYRLKWKQSRMSQPEYKPFIEAFARQGFVNLGQRANKDSMHFEFTPAGLAAAKARGDEV